MHALLLGEQLGERSGTLLSSRSRSCKAGIDDMDVADWEAQQACPSIGVLRDSRGTVMREDLDTDSDIHNINVGR